MVDIKESWDFRIEGEKIITIRTREYKNGKGNPVKQIDEEELSYIDVCESIFENISKNLDDGTKKILEKEEEIKKFEDEVGDGFNSSDYKAYIAFLKDPATAKCDALFKKEVAIRAGKQQLELFNKDFVKIEEQYNHFVKMKEAYEKHCEKEEIVIPEYVPPEKEDKKEE